MRFVRIMQGNSQEDSNKRREDLLKEIFGDDWENQMAEAAKEPPKALPPVGGETPNPETGLIPVEEAEYEERTAFKGTEPGQAENSEVPNWTREQEDTPLSQEDVQPEPEAKAAEEEVRPKTHEEILAKNTNYVFIFGYTGSGKSTVLTAINMYMRQHYRVILNQLENREGIRLIHKMMRDLEEGDFPQPTSVGKITEYDTAFTIDGEDVNITFLEMAGEDLKKVDVDDGDDGLDEHVKAYLTCPGISISFLLVADYERVVKRKEDKLILQFLSYLYNENIDMSRVGVILSKFDRDKTDKNIEEVIKSYLPQVDKWLTSGDIAQPRVFPFSVGSVQSVHGKKDAITDLDLDDCGAIVPWVHEVLSLAEPVQQANTQSKGGVGEQLKKFLGFGK